MKSKRLQHPSCSFCGKKQSDVLHMFQGKNSCICNECIDACNEVIRSRTSKAEIEGSGSFRLLPIKEIKKRLDDYVIGQENIKKLLSVAVYTHFKRLYHNFGVQKNDIELDKSNILLIGATGSGKTLLASTLARIVNVPFAIADATTLTEAGYVGDDVENILLRLIQNADFNVERAEKGIIFVDEIDKISRKSENTSITRDVSGEGVQQALLKIMEGTVASVPAKGGRKHPQSSNIRIDTKNILFICGGAFVELEKIIQARLNQAPIGFKKEEEREKVADESILKHANPDDLVKFGLIPELIGRLPIIGALEELTDEELRDVLLKPKNSIIKQYKKLFEMEGIELEITEDAIQTIIEAARALNTGARGLRSTMEKILFKLMYEADSSKETKIIIDKDQVIREHENLAAIA